MWLWERSEAVSLSANRLVIWGSHSIRVTCVCVCVCVCAYAGCACLGVCVCVCAWVLQEFDTMGRHEGNHLNNQYKADFIVASAQ